MKYFGEFRDDVKYLSEGKVSMAKLKAGLKLRVIHKGRSAKNFGVDGEDVYGGKVKVLGIGVKPYKQLQSKRHVLAKDLKDLKNKYKEVFKSEEIQFGHFFSSLDRLNAAVDMMIDQDRKLRGPGGLVWLWQVLEGENKGHVGFCYLTREPGWEVDFLNKSTEFVLET